MQPLQWDSVSKKQLSESLNLFAVPESLRPPNSSSFGEHLYGAKAEPKGSRPEPPKNQSETTPPAPTSKTSYPPPASEQSQPQQQPPERREDPPSAEPPSASASKKTSESAAKPDQESAAASSQSSDTEQNNSEVPSADALSKEAAAPTQKLRNEIESKHLADRTEAAAKAKGKSHSGKPKSGAAKQKAANRPDEAGAEKDSPRLHAIGVNAQPANTPTLVEALPQDVPIHEETAEPSSLEHEKKIAEAAVANAGKLALKETMADQVDAGDRSTSESRSAGKRDSHRVGEVASPGELAAGKATSTIGPQNQTVLAMQQSTESSNTAGSAKSSGSPDGGQLGKPTVTGPQESGSSGPSLRFAQHLAAKPGARAAKTSPLSDAEHARLVDRVARAFQAAEARGGAVTLRLHPPELGALRVELRVTDGVLSARLEAETPAARTILLDNVQMLHERLAEQGVRIERFDVDLLDRRAAGDPGGFEHQQAREEPPRQSSPAQSAPQEPTDADVARIPIRPHAPGNLNVIV